MLDKQDQRSNSQSPASPAEGTHDNWTHHEHIADLTHVHAQQSIESAGSADLAKHAVEVVAEEIEEIMEKSELAANDAAGREARSQAKPKRLLQLNHSWSSCLAIRRISIYSNRRSRPENTAIGIGLSRRRQTADGHYGTTPIIRFPDDSNRSKQPLAPPGARQKATQAAIVTLAVFPPNFFDPRGEMS